MSIVIGDFEEREKELIFENNQLRKTLYSLYQHVSGEESDAPLYQLPFEMSKETIEQSIQAFISKSKESNLSLVQQYNELKLNLSNQKDESVQLQLQKVQLQLGK